MASEKLKKIYNLLYQDQTKEYSFSGSLNAEKKMWDKFFDALDKEDHQTAANVYRTLEENNWHKMTDAMDKEVDKPRSERKGYFDHAESWNEDRKDKLRKFAKKNGAQLASDKARANARAAFTVPGSRLTRFSQEKKDRINAVDSQRMKDTIFKNRSNVVG